MQANNNQQNNMLVRVNNNNNNNYYSNTTGRIFNNRQALLVIDRTFFNQTTNASLDEVNNFIKLHKCILWTIRGTYAEDKIISDLSFINGRIIGLVDNAKNMTYIRNLFRSEKEYLYLPSILIDYNLNEYIHTGFDWTIDLKDYITIGLQKYINVLKVFEDINNFLQVWYDHTYEFESSITSGIIAKPNTKLTDYKF